MTQEELEKMVLDMDDKIKALQSELRSFVNLTYRQSIRLKNGIGGIKKYYVADTNGGTVDRRLTFIDGILTFEIQSASSSLSPSVSPSSSISPSTSPS